MSEYGSDILKLTITAMILEAIIYIYNTYNPLCSENIHILLINPNNIWSYTCNNFLFL